MGWTDAARRALVGDKVLLACSAGELWIRPKKLSQEAVDAIKEERAKATSGQEMKETLRRAMKLREKYPGLLDGEGLEAVAEEDQVEILSLYTALNTSPQREIFRLALLHGIGEHNFADEAGKLIGEGKCLDAPAVDEVLEWSDLAAEIYGVVEAYNRPLAARTGGTLPRSRSGSTAERGSARSPASSPTAGTR